jgi:2,3-dihydroxybenzoate-AMP ligase
MAEGLLNFTRLDDPPEVIHHTQGRPASPADECLIVDDLGRTVKDGEVGELLTRGPYTIHGYLASPMVNAAHFTADGFYRTGDLVRLHSSGNFIVQGRAAEVINCGGEKVCAQELEELLATHPSVGQCAVVAVPHYLFGEAPCAYVIPRGDDVVTLRDLRTFLVDLGVAPYKLPVHVEVVDHLPFTAVGKVDRATLRRDAKDKVIHDHD